VPIRFLWRRGRGRGESGRIDPLVERQHEDAISAGVTAAGIGLELRRLVARVEIVLDFGGAVACEV
jgi:hypothetical protein